MKEGEYQEGVKGEDKQGGGKNWRETREIKGEKADDE